MPSEWILTVSRPDAMRLPLPNAWVHGAMARWLDQFGHHNDKTKPWSITTLAPAGARAADIRIGTLDDGLADGLGALTAGEHELRFGPHLVVSRPTQSGLAFQRPWDDLHANARLQTTFRFSFLTPTAFRSGGRWVPMPNPKRIFGSLRARWNKWAPASLSIRLDIPSVNLIEEEVDVRTVRVRTRAGQQPAFLGTVMYRCQAGDGEQRRLLDQLASLARFCGVGTGTTSGLGVVVYQRGDVQRPGRVA